MELENKMKKVFNASLLATAVAVSFGASAATFTSTPVKLSAEGVAAGNTYVTPFAYDTTVANTHSAGSTIVLTFSDKVDLTALDGTHTCSNNVSAGTAICGSGALNFDYGTGAYTFDNVIIDKDASTITYSVNLGGPMLAGSAYRTTVTGAVISGASNVDFASDLAGTPIETGTGAIATEHTQFTVTLKQDIDGVVDRVNQDKFVTTSGSVYTNTSGQVVIVDNAAALEADATLVSAAVNLHADWSNRGTTASPILWSGADFTLTDGVTPGTGTINAGKTVMSFASSAAGTWGLSFDNSTTQMEPVTQSFNASATITFGDSMSVTTAATTNVSYQAETGFGEWRLDASVVNVPYLPVGYGLSPNVEVANDSNATSEAEIIIEGFDNAGNQYGPVTLTKKAAGKTVTKISEDDIMTAFGITGKAKLSVTFIIDADEDKVTLAPYYRENESRVNVMSDQYKADSIR
jgi:hypothetical protein